MRKTTVKVKGMSCHHCKMAVENELKKLDGVKFVSVNLDAGNAEIEFDETKVDMAKIKEAIEEAGYEAE